MVTIKYRCGRRERNWRWMNGYGGVEWSRWSGRVNGLSRRNKEDRGRMRHPCAVSAVEGERYWGRAALGPEIADGTGAGSMALGPKGSGRGAEGLEEGHGVCPSLSVGTVEARAIDGMVVELGSARG